MKVSISLKFNNKSFGEYKKEEASGVIPHQKREKKKDDL